jgi:hypothetical protein
VPRDRRNLRPEANRRRVLSAAVESASGKKLSSTPFRATVTRDRISG